MYGLANGEGWVCVDGPDVLPYCVYTCDLDLLLCMILACLPDSQWCLLGMKSKSTGLKNRTSCLGLRSGKGLVLCLLSKIMLLD